MSYATATVQSSTQPAEDLYNGIKALLSAHAAWQFVEDYQSGGATHSVWKCLGTANGVTDFYVCFSRTSPPSSSVATLNISCFENYNPTTHAYGRPAPYAFSAVQDPSTSADHSYGGGTAWVIPNSQNPAQSGSGGTTASLWTMSVAGNTSAFTYFAFVWNDGLALVTSTSGSPGGVQVGLFDSLVANPATNDPVPLGLFYACSVASAINPNWSSTGFGGSTTRHPVVSTPVAYAWAFSPGYTYLYYPLSPGRVGDAAGDVFQQGYWGGYRRALVAQGPVAAGTLRGLVRHRLVFNTLGVSQGDTITVGSSTYVAIGASLVGMDFLDSSAA